MYCIESWHPTYLIITSEAPRLLYYTHIPAVLIALILGLFVYVKSKNLVSKILLFISVFFSVWVFFNLIAWVNDTSLIISFVWAFFPLLTALIAILTLYFFYVFMFQRDLNLIKKILIFSPLLPILILTPTILNIKYFDLVNCEAINNIYLVTYYYIVGGLAMTGILGLLISSWWKKINITKKEAIFMAIGLELFLLLFLSLGYIASYLENYNIEFYGLFGMVIFMAFLAYMIVRFKTFDIKLLATQALVWALLILIGAQFFFIQSNVNRILTAITLVISGWLGLIIIRSVKKEVALREELEIANNNQQLLIRFITHQVKGFFTKSKMVFSSILEGDVGEVSGPVKEIVEQGMDSDNQAVAMVQEILHASSLRSGKMTYNFEETDFTEFVRGIAEMFKDNAVKKGLNLEINLPQEKIFVKIDKLHLTQVIKNLIDNSIKYTISGFVKVNLKTNGKKISFSIIDSGIGLSEDDKGKLFKEGGRGEESLRVNVQSTGYGLYIVKKIVEGHGGKVWAESAGRGQGTTFYVEIPLSVK